MNHPHYQKVKDALDALFDDTSVSPEETLEALGTLKEDIEGLMLIIQDDLRE